MSAKEIINRYLDNGAKLSHDDVKVIMTALQSVEKLEKQIADMKTDYQRRQEGYVHTIKELQRKIDGEPQPKSLSQRIEAILVTDTMYSLCTITDEIMEEVRKSSLYDIFEKGSDK